LEYPIEMSKLLLDSHPVLIIPELACILGVTEAVVLQQIHYWIQINQKTNQNFHNGEYWTYNSYENWQKQFPFWSVTTIRRALVALEKHGLVVVGNFNRKNFDRTRWYRIDHKRFAELIGCSCVQNGQIEYSKLARPIPETNIPETKKEKKAGYGTVHELGMLTVVSQANRSRLRRWKKN
jgi:Fe2+ or Zn2+ uptake regulation protein